MNLTKPCIGYGSTPCPHKAQVMNVAQVKRCKPCGQAQVKVAKSESYRRHQEEYRVHRKKPSPEVAEKAARKTNTHLAILRRSVALA